MTKIIFLRHAQVEKDPSVNASLWGLSEEGEQNAKKLLNEKELISIDSFYSSTEKKAYLTVKPLADKGKKEVNQLHFFDEVKRGDKFLSKEEFEVEKKKQLRELDYHAFDGESARQALKRFKEGVELVTKENKNKTLIVATHGTVLNLYFAHLLSAFDKIEERWEKTGFCVYGVVEDGEVLKDIAGE